MRFDESLNRRGKGINDALSWKLFEDGRPKKGGEALAHALPVKSRISKKAG